jgi:predicted ATP-grasp superfamily ATP-dependent carboligase
MNEVATQRCQPVPEVRAPSGAMAPALVLNVGRHVLHHGGLGIIRSLGRMGVPVYAVVDDRFTPAAVSRYLAGAFVWDTRGLDAGRFLEGMALIGRRLGRPTVVIPTGDGAAILAAEHTDALREWFLLPGQPAALLRTLACKRELSLLCQRLGAPCPQTLSPASLDEVRQFAARAAFPVVVKAAEAWELPEGVKPTVVARTPEHLFALYEAAGGRRSHLLLQEFIDQDRGEDWFYHGYRNARSGHLVGFTGRKLRSYPVFAGPTTLGKSIVNEPLRRQAEGLLEAVGYGGIVDLDFRLDRRDGRYKLLDFNPRIGAQFRLFEDEAGLDVARALYLDLTGNLPPPRPMVERTFVAEFHDLAASLGYYRRGKLTFCQWRRSLEGRRELAWLSRDDGAPFAAVCVRLIMRVAELFLRLKPSKVVDAPPHYVRGRRRSPAPRAHPLLRGVQP